MLTFHYSLDFIFILFSSIRAQWTPSLPLQHVFNLSVNSFHRSLTPHIHLCFDPVIKSGSFSPNELNEIFNTFNFIQVWDPEVYFFKENYLLQLLWNLEQIAIRIWVFTSNRRVRETLGVSGLSEVELGEKSDPSQQIKLKNYSKTTLVEKF